MSLSAKETEWLNSHGTIRVGYQDNYLAFCATDSSGKLTGALKDFLEFASNSLKIHIDFEAVSYPTASAAMDAMKSGEIDCVFPANLTDSDAETIGVMMSPALMRTEMYAVVRMSEQKSFVYKKDVTVAVNEGNPNYDYFLVDNFPDWKTKHYKNTPVCLDKVAEGEADCVLISNYRFNNISKQCEKLHLTTVSTGIGMDYCFAVTAGQTQLYSILSRVTTLVPSSVMSAALTYYSTEDAKVGFADLVRDNLAFVVAVISIIAMIIMLLVFRSMRAEKRASLVVFSRLCRISQQTQ